MNIVKALKEQIEKKSSNKIKLMINDMTFDIQSCQINTDHHYSDALGDSLSNRWTDGREVTLTFNVNNIRANSLMHSLSGGNGGSSN